MQIHNVSIPNLITSAVIIRTTLITLSLLLFSSKTGYSQYKENSILAEGEIFKIAVSETGIHKIPASFFSDQLGIDISSVIPQNISIYGNGGGLIPEENSATRIDDLEELAITVVGEADAIFNDQDYILFYAEGADLWRYDNQDQNMRYEKNIYDLNNYYFIKINDNEGKRINTFNNSDINPEINLSESDLFVRHENDLVNLLGGFGSTEGTGQLWFGELFAANSNQNFGGFFDISDVSNADAQITLAAAARSSSRTSFRMDVEGSTAELSISQSNISNVEASYAQRRTLNFSGTINGPELDLNLLYSGNAGALGWLDYIELRTKKDNVYKGLPLLLYNLESLNFQSASFDIDNASNNLSVWNITDPFNTLTFELQNGNGSASLNFNIEDQLPQFIIFDQNHSFPEVSFVEKVENQNLHGLSGAEFVIVYPDEFAEAAITLANHRNTLDNISIQLVRIDQIYNEFGGGKKDVSALRDFSRMYKEKYDEYNILLLLGDASYDYRNIVPGLPNQNFVPTYETKESLSPIYGFPSDDYFALLSENEGSDNLRGALDISVGRLPARSLEDAINMVEKIIYYDTSPNVLGDWKLNLSFVGDDEDNNTHLEDSEEIAIRNEENYPLYNQSKVYFDAYEQVSTPGGERYPEAREDINQAIEKGQLVVNYLGHGGPKGWAQERVIQVADVNSWSNEDRMPIIVTATCSFTGYDDPSLVTAGEHAISNPKGAIALFTTVRAVFADENKRLASAVYDQLFEKIDGNAQRLGEILSNAKNANPQDTFRSNARKFTLIGDPSMRMALPKKNIELLKINDIDVELFNDTIQALSNVSLEGRITDEDNQFLSNFNGVLSLSVYDKASQITTLANDEKSQVTDFFVRKNVLFKGSATVKNGEFSIDFILPKDINFETGLGKFSFYASDLNSIDAAGFYDNVMIGGSSNLLADDTPPIIQLFMNDESFVNGGITDSDPILLAKLDDDFGINVSGTSIGHDLTMVLDDQIDQTVVLNEFYEATTDDFSSGTVRFQLNDLEPGLHKIRVKAFDISNNSSEAELEFEVIGEDNTQLFKTFNFPNPFIDFTNFSFEHDLGNQDVNISINIYSITGKFVRSIETQRFDVGYRISDLRWDGKDHYGNKLASGMYLYQINISSPNTGEIRESEFGKLILI